MEQAKVERLQSLLGIIHEKYEEIDRLWKEHRKLVEECEKNGHKYPDGTCAIDWEDRNQECQICGTGN